jgi:hypothetical protein
MKRAAIQTLIAMAATFVIVPIALDVFFPR